MQQPHKKLDKARLRGVEISDYTLDNVKQTKTIISRPDLDARIERFNVESEHDVMLLQLCCLSIIDDGSMAISDMSAVLDHSLEVRTQIHIRCTKQKILVIADETAGHRLLVNLCHDEKECATVLALLTREKLLYFSVMTLDMIALSVMILNDCVPLMIFCEASASLIRRVILLS